MHSVVLCWCMYFKIYGILKPTAPGHSLLWLSLRMDLTGSRVVLRWPIWGCSCSCFIVILMCVLSVMVFGFALPLSLPYLLSLMIISKEDHIFFWRFKAFSRHSCHCRIRILQLILKIKQFQTFVAHFCGFIGNAISSKSINLDSFAFNHSCASINTQRHFLSLILNCKVSTFIYCVFSLWYLLLCHM